MCFLSFTLTSVDVPCGMVWSPTTKPRGLGVKFSPFLFYRWLIYIPNYLIIFVVSKKMTEKIKRKGADRPSQRPQQPPKQPVGRPKADIDLEQLEKLSALNCTMPELAAYFKVPLRTLEDRYTNDPKVRSCIDQGRELGRLSVWRKQMQLMEEHNNPTMAIWLGKQLLGQRENMMW